MTEDQIKNLMRSVRGAIARSPGKSGREAALAGLAVRLRTTKHAARCLLGANDAMNGVTAPNFSAKVNAASWLKLYELIKFGYARTAWGVLQTALENEHARVVLNSEGQENASSKTDTEDDK